MNVCYRKLNRMLFIVSGTVAQMRFLNALCVPLLFGQILACFFDILLTFMFAWYGAKNEIYLCDTTIFVAICSWNVQAANGGAFGGLLSTFKSFFEWASFFYRNDMNECHCEFQFNFISWHMPIVNCPFHILVLLRGNKNRRGSFRSAATKEWQYFFSARIFKVSVSFQTFSVTCRFVECWNSTISRVAFQAKSSKFTRKSEQCEQQLQTSCKYSKNTHSAM